MKAKVVTLIGGQSLAGTYVLRIRVHESLSLAFGRFKGGRLIQLEPGDFLYVGSALARKGASCLARRLVRHATRTGNNPPHAIRANMLSEFGRADVNCGDLRPKNGKRLHWNVDHLLDQCNVDLVAVLLIRSPLRLESDLSRLLNADPAIRIVERRLGANDVAGNTHLVQVIAGASWWNRLPSRLAVFLESRQTNLEIDTPPSPACTDLNLTDRQRVILRNMHSRRRRAIQRRMRRGMSFSAAEKKTQHVFDTVGWHEVVSRLARAHGIVCKMLREISHVRAPYDCSFLSDVRQLATQIAVESTALRKLLPPTRQHSWHAQFSWRLSEAQRPRRDKVKISCRYALGQLKAAFKFISKCRRDGPEIETRGGTPLSPEQRLKIDLQCKQIRSVAGCLVAAVRSSNRADGLTFQCPDFYQATGV